MLTAEFSCGSGQAVSRAHSTHQVIDWQHWSQLLAQSAEATTHTHTPTHAYKRTHCLVQKYIRSDLKKDLCVVAGLLYFVLFNKKPTVRRD